MAITMTGGPIGAGGRVIGAQMDVQPAVKRLQMAGLRLLSRVAVEGQRFAAQGMLVDTGWARGHVESDVDPAAMTSRFGILQPFNNQDGAGVAAYAAMQDAGIKRHFVSFWNSNGSLRTMLVKWCERHGLKIWRGRRDKTAEYGGGLATAGGPLTAGNYGRSLTDVGRGLAARGLWVWGRAHPWLSNARYFVLQKFPQFLQEQQNTL
jgi:hypothetical protein